MYINTQNIFENPLQQRPLYTWNCIWNILSKNNKLMHFVEKSDCYLHLKNALLRKLVFKINIPLFTQEVHFVKLFNYQTLSSLLILSIHLLIHDKIIILTQRPLTYLINCHQGRFWYWSVNGKKVLAWKLTSFCILKS